MDTPDDLLGIAASLSNISEVYSSISDTNVRKLINENVYGITKWDDGSYSNAISFEERLNGVFS
jgi:hypothetical protein